MKKIVLLLLPAFFCLTNTNAQIIANARDSLKILLQKEKRDTSRVMLLVELGRAYQSNSPDSAMLLLMEALSLSQRIGFVKGEASSLIRIGGAYGNVGNYTKAMQVWLQAMKLSEKNNYLDGMAITNNNIGGIYFTQGEYHQAINYLLKAKKLNEQMNDKRALALNLSSLGRNYFGLKQYDSARVFAQQAYDLGSKINNPRTTGFALNTLGSINSQTGQKKLALEYFRLSIPYLMLSKENVGLSSTFLEMAKLFESDGQIDSTLFYANLAFEIKRINRGARLKEQVSAASSFLSSFYENIGKADSALFYLKIAKAANDSLSNKENINQLQSLMFDEKLRQIDLAAAELKAKKDRKHNLQFAALAIGLITFIILFFALSRSIIVKAKFIEFFGVLLLLAVFEFINLLIHPYLERVTDHSPVLMLLILIAIGALLVPLHHRMEKWMTHVMVEKNKKIRLEAARKTIERLEPTIADAT